MNFLAFEMFLANFWQLLSRTR